MQAQTAGIDTGRPCDEALLRPAEYVRGCTGVSEERVDAIGEVWAVRVIERKMRTGS